MNPCGRRGPGQRGTHQHAFASTPAGASAPAVANLRRVLALIRQEKRFLLFLFLREQTRFLTDYEIASAIKDQRSNVVRNLHAFVAEGLVTPRRDRTQESQAFEWMLGS